MPELHVLLILFGVGAAAGMINVMAGGGSTLTLPVLVLLGVDASVANGTNRVAIVVQNISATLAFKAEKKTRLRESISYGLWAIPGALTGAFIATRIEDAWFERILGVLLIVVVLTMIVPRSSPDSESAVRESPWSGPVLLLLGFYGGFIHMGVGFLFMAVFFHLLNMDLVSTTVHKIVIILLYSIPALLVFAIAGDVDWVLGFSLAAGNATGAFAAAKIAVRRGEKAIRMVLIVAVLIMALKILGIL